MGNSSPEFKTLLRKIRDGEAVDDLQLLPFLALESKDDRRQVNLQLAETYFSQFQQGRQRQYLHRARSCVERAWLLSRYSPEILPLFIEIHRALEDVAAIELALKRCGLECARRGDFDEALALFDRWAYARAEFTGIDTHSYDADIIAAVERMSALHRFDARHRLRPRQDAKIRLAYLMHGLTQINSVLVRIDRLFARFHDKSRFEVAYFSIENESAVAANPDAQAAIDDIQRQQCELFLAPAGKTLYEQLLAVGRQIYDFEPDLLVTTAGLGTFKNYVITCLEPAPVTMGFHQGPSPQFSWHTFDHSIAWCFTNQLDCPADCSQVPLEFDLPNRQDISPASRADLDIPASAIVMASGGRWHKFQGADFWRAMTELLLKHDNLYWMVSGVVEDQVPFLGGLLTPEVRSKIRFKGWSRDYLEHLAAADIVVDTYPVGGGVFMLEAMALGLPVVSFDHDYVTYYDNNDCSGGPELVGVPELIMRRGDFQQLKDQISKMVEDAEYRCRLGEMCYERVRQTLDDPARMVRRFEKIYARVLDARRAEAEASAGVSAAALPEATSAEGLKELEDRKLMLIEQAAILNRREAELNRREARRLVPRVRNSLRWRWQRLRGRS